ncbi:helix-turn-helix domain-containing protein [Mycobacteroides abscessus]|uniref:helix-turn-helix domain-containing protein n=1 Tax=Mycobacteroides abscessus TaxID=36809 RepID=UPI001D0C9B53
MTQSGPKRPSWTERPPDSWAEREAHRLAREVYRLRGKRSAQWLAARTKELGHEVSRSVISDLENGRRRYVTTAELVILAAALDTSPVTLMYPGPYSDSVEFLPEREVPEFDAAQWFSANGWSQELASAFDGDFGFAWRTDQLRQWRRLAELEDARARVTARAELDRDRDQIEMYDRMIRQLWQQIEGNEDA